MKICVVHRYPLTDILSTNPSFRILLEELCAEGHRVHLVNYRKRGGEGGEHISSLDSITHSTLGLTYDRSQRLDRILKSILFIFIAPLKVLVKHLRERFDVVYCDDALPVYYFFIKKLTNSRVVYRMGDLMLGYIFDVGAPVKRRLFEIALKADVRMLNSLDNVLAISNVMRDFLLKCGVHFDRVTVVPECIDTEMFNSSISGEMIRSKYGISGPLLMFQGVLVPWKGVENLLSAMSLVLKRHSQVKIMIVGDGPSLIHLKELSDDLGISENVIFTGWVPFKNMPEYIAACDIGVSLRKKNLANEMVVTTALLQFFAIGKPVIAPKMKTITHFVEQAENGLLFNPDDPQDLADKLIYSIDHLDKMMKMGRRETLLVRQTYDISTVAAQLKDIILGANLFKPVRS